VCFFIIGTAGLVHFLDYRNYILIPSCFILLFAVIYGYKKNKRVANRLVTGLWIGLVATLALEAVRIPSIYVQWIPHDDMIALPGNLLTNPPTIQDFNAMIRHHETKETMQQNGNDNMKMADPMKSTAASNRLLNASGHNGPKAMSNNDVMTKDSSMKQDSQIITSGQQQQKQLTQLGNENPHMSRMMGDSMMQDSTQPFSVLVVGGLYHFWNGATMAAVYTLVIGRGRWYYGLMWGFIINIGMMLAPWMIPMVGPFGINYGPGYTIFIASLLAHLAYGAVVGILAHRFIKDSRSLVNIIKPSEANVR
jgi:hypothetical protein